MSELHSNGNYEAYLAQLFNPATAGGQFNPGAFGPPGAGGGLGAGYGGLSAGAPNAIGAQQSPWAQQNPFAQQNLSQMNGLWPQQQTPHLAHALAAVQIAQQIAARNAVHAIQCAQALQQIAQHSTAQQGQQGMGGQPQFGKGQLGQGQFGQGIGGFGAGQIGQPNPQFLGWAQNPINQALQQHALLQLAQYLATQQPGQYRYGLAA
jgi:hypothetical protein